MGQKIKKAEKDYEDVLAGALTTVSLQTLARGGVTPLPLEEIQQLSAVFDLIKTDYVEPVSDKKLITDAISGMVSSLDPHSQYFDKKSYKEFKEGTTGKFVGVNVPNGIPLVYELDADLKPIRHYYLGDAEAAAKAAAAVASQGKA